MDILKNNIPRNIPKIIFQTWKTKKLPEKFKEWSDTWKNMNPNFEYRFYTDKDCYKFIYTNYPEYLDLYESLITIEKIDVFRYLVLHKYGGIYVDMDCECLKPIDDLLDLFPNSLITGFEYESPIQYLQWFIACPQGYNTIIELVEEIKKRNWYKWFKSFTLTENELVYWSTGPVVYTYILKKTKESVVVLEKGKLGCYDKNRLTKQSYLTHHFASTWKKIKNNTLVVI